MGPMADFFKTVTLSASEKAERILFWHPAMRQGAESIFIVEYLREFESLCKTVLAHESGDSGVLFNEKNRGLKISWDSPFKLLLCWCQIMIAQLAN
jgi:hypothetical protein